MIAGRCANFPPAEKREGGGRSHGPKSGERHEKSCKPRFCGLAAYGVPGQIRTAGLPLRRATSQHFRRDRKSIESLKVQCLTVFPATQILNLTEVLRRFEGPLSFPIGGLFAALRKSGRRFKYNLVQICTPRFNLSVSIIEVPAA